MNKGFTLVELIAVIVILALLVIITTPAYDTVSTNIKTRNYESKKSSIKAQTLSYVEKYMKNDVYNGSSDKGKGICFTVDYLIQNGIISSDSDTEEYIKNDITGEEYKNEKIFIKVAYDYINLKLIALTEGESKKIYDDIDDDSLDRTISYDNLSGISGTIHYIECTDDNKY